MLLAALLPLLLAAPAQPKVSLLILHKGHPKSVERTRTALAVLPTITLTLERTFPEAHKTSIATTLNSLGRFPSRLGLGILRKQLQKRGIDALVVAAVRGLYLVTKETIRGPYGFPGPKQTLDPALLQALSYSNRHPSRVRKKRRPVSWWKNWIFWTGVALVTGGVVALSIISQQPETVEIHVRTPGG